VLPDPDDLCRAAEYWEENDSQLEEVAHTRTRIKSAGAAHQLRMEVPVLDGNMRDEREGKMRKNEV